MKRLLLLRHAKSSRDNPALEDRERPLNERGKEAAKQMGRLLREEGLVPDLIVSSTAVRAGRREWMAPEAAAFDEATGAWSDPARYARWRAENGRKQSWLCVAQSVQRNRTDASLSPA